MIDTKKHGRFQYLFHKNATAWLLAIGALSGSSAAPAQQLTVADLERAFWICDYTATVRGVYATPVETCATITNRLKQQKFNGSFEDFLAWWRFNKPAEHEKLSTRSRTSDLASVRGAD